MSTNPGLPNSNEEWKRKLGRKAFKIMRLGETERPGSGKYLKERRAGVYHCRGCHNELFDAKAKFDSQTGWPSFYEPVDANHIEQFEDHSYGVIRLEVRCANCGGHLGHLFFDAPDTPTGSRYCVNSASLNFKRA